MTSSFREWRRISASAQRLFHVTRDERAEKDIVIRHQDELLVAFSAAIVAEDVKQLRASLACALSASERRKSATACRLGRLGADANAAAPKASLKRRPIPYVSPNDGQDVVAGRRGRRQVR